MYSEEEYAQVRKLTSKRLKVTIIPMAILFAMAIGLFVYGQLARSETLWMVTAALTIAAGCGFFFLYGVYVRPMRMYRLHMDCMLHGRKRETTGVLKSFGDKTVTKNEIDCYPLMLNVGERDEGEDDRLFYFDSHKPKPDIPLGTRITIQSNDMMVADYHVN